ncbi:hypothetical protein LLS1_35400 [Leifsonia sp. LS1]|nr:hypothetical protein LLS1_35400 [Leifsonia sp. LS1]
MLLVDQDWPGTRATLTVQSRRTAGLGHGWGLLTDRELDIVAVGRGNGESVPRWRRRRHHQSRSAAARRYHPGRPIDPDQIDASEEP